MMTAQGLLALPKQFYPVFDVCHILLCVLTVRKEAGKAFAHDHPAAALVSCLVSSFAGSLLANPLLGKPVFAAFSDEFLVLVCFVLFLLVFFSPGDIFYTLVKLQPIYVVICVVKEIYRVKKVFGGLGDGSKAFQNSPVLIPVSIGVLKGNGSGFMAPIARAIRGDFRPKDSEFMRPSVTTKNCLLAAVIFATMGTPDVIYVSLVGLCISTKLSSIFTSSTVDPFVPLESVVSLVLNALSSPAKEKPH